jgi:DNA-binding response OmpR family regulator
MCKELKKNNNTSHIPLIFLTAKTSDIDKIEGLNTGAVDYIVKPFDPKELKIKVDNILTDRKKNRIPSTKWVLKRFLG